MEVLSTQQTHPILETEKILSGTTARPKFRVYVGVMVIYIYIYIHIHIYVYIYRVYMV